MVTKKQTYCILTICAISIFLSIYVMIKSDIIKEEIGELNFPTPIIVTPLDSYNPCYSQDIWSVIE